MDILEQPRIIQQPLPSVIDLGGKCILKVVGTGDPKPTFQWFKNNRIRRGLTGNEYIIQETILDDTANYHCELTNSVGSVKSNIVTVNVIAQEKVVSVKVEVNIPDVKEKCQRFSVKDFQETVNHILRPDLLVTKFIPLGTKTKFCDVTACSENPCLNGGRCFLKKVGYQCLCKPAWSGKHCEHDINECIQEVDTCFGNNSRCENRNGSFFCRCSLGLTGQRCEYKNGACKSNSCDTRQEVCVPSQATGVSCVNKHNVIDLMVNVNISSWSQQNRYEFVDGINNVLKSLSSTHSFLFDFLIRNVRKYLFL